MRCVDKTPLNTPPNTTILSSIRLNGQTAYTTYKGGTTAEKFKDYLKNVLAPVLCDGDVVVMDNMRTHHAKEVKKVIEELKINVIFCLRTVPIIIRLRRCGQKSKLFCAKSKQGLIPN